MATTDSQRPNVEFSHGDHMFVTGPGGTATTTYGPPDADWDLVITGLDFVLVDNITAFDQVLAQWAGSFSPSIWFFQAAQAVGPTAALFWWQWRGLLKLHFGESVQVSIGSDMGSPQLRWLLGGYYTAHVDTP